MSENSGPPIIIKRKKVVEGGGHHGGAWKVAYADFVTAMMAFFLLMWLLGATSENQRKGIADYFNPTITVNRTSGGGDGVFGGDSVFTKENFASNGTGPVKEAQVQGERAGALNGNQGVGVSDSSTDAPKGSSELPTIYNEIEIPDEISEFAEALAGQITLKRTDEGIVIEIFDVVDNYLFEQETSKPTKILIALTRDLSKVLEKVPNDLAISAHSRTLPLVRRDRDTWELTVVRASVVRDLLAKSSILEDKMVRLTGHSDRKLALVNPLAFRNNRIEIILLN